ncbi:MAG: DNA repair protein RecO [Gammaproteobacteria bacterium]|nr:DNA repair protein RecO [Gammaproteobacteria bacterium]
MRVELQPAYIIHRRPYRNTSWLLEVLTREYGLIALVAKGARRPGNAWRFLLEPFNSLLISFSGRNELMTLTSVEPGEYRTQFVGDKIYAGMYMNELLLRLLHRNDPHEELFSTYMIALNELDSAADSIEPPLRRFELCLLREVGYGIQLDHALDANVTYFYDVEKGPIEVSGPTNQQPLIHGRCLLALAQNDFSNAELFVEMKYLLRHVLNHYLSGKPLKSRELFTGKKI